MRDFLCVKQKGIKLLISVPLNDFIVLNQGKFVDFVAILCSTEQASSKSFSIARTRSAVFFLNKLKHNSLQRRKVGTKHQAIFTLYTAVLFICSKQQFVPGLIA